MPVVRSIRSTYFEVRDGLFEFLLHPVPLLGRRRVVGHSFEDVTNAPSLIAKRLSHLECEFGDLLWFWPVLRGETGLPREDHVEAPCDGPEREKSQRSCVDADEQ